MPMDGCDILLILLRDSSSEKDRQCVKYECSA
jgi:hypothetical protein